MSIAMNQGKLAQAVNISLMKNVMDTSKENANLMMEMMNTNVQAMERSVTPHLGSTIDIKL